jgi:glutamyl-tRNA reductase
MYVPKQLAALGISFRTASAELREAISLDPSTSRELLRMLQEELPETEAVVLSTCNRTEFYLASRQLDAATERLFTCLARLRPEASVATFQAHRFDHRGEAAARHLYRIACGLESAILGDVQILSQIRAALTCAARAGTLGKFLNRVFTKALELGANVRTSTAISRGAASTGSAVASILQARFGKLAERERPSILLLGAGETAASIARQIAKRRLGTLVCANRTHAKAVQLAEQCGAEILPYDRLQSGMRAADVLITATSAAAPVVSREQLDALAAHGPSRPLLIIDAGLPRNVEPASTVEIIDIDRISEQREEIVRERQAAVPRVESCIAEEVDAWQTWEAGLPLEETIKQLYLDAGDLTRETLQHAAARESANPSELERVLARGLKHLLHRHVSRLRESASRQRGSVQPVGPSTRDASLPTDFQRSL